MQCRLLSGSGIFTLPRSCLFSALDARWLWLALGLCWKSGIAAEVIGLPENTIGENLYNAKIYLNTPDLFAWTLVIVVVSVLFERIFLRLIDLGVRRVERMR